MPRGVDVQAITKRRESLVDILDSSSNLLLLLHRLNSSDSIFSLQLSTQVLCLPLPSPFPAPPLSLSDPSLSLSTTNNTDLYNSNKKTPRYADSSQDVREKQPTTTTTRRPGSEKRKPWPSFRLGIFIDQGNVSERKKTKENAWRVFIFDMFFFFFPSLENRARRRRRKQSADLRNTAELDLDNTSERTCLLFDAPPPSPPSLLPSRRAIGIG